MIDGMTDAAELTAGGLGQLAQSLAIDGSLGWADTLQVPRTLARCWRALSTPDYRAQCLGHDVAWMRRQNPGFRLASCAFGS